jgi:hypothetical protein
MCTSRDPDDVDRTERERRERDHDYGQVERKMAYHAFDLTSTTLAGLGSSQDTALTIRSYAIPTR